MQPPPELSVGERSSGELWSSSPPVVLEGRRELPQGGDLHDEGDEEEERWSRGRSGGGSCREEKQNQGNLDGKRKS